MPSIQLACCESQNSCLPCASCQGGGSGRTLPPGSQPAFLGRSNAYCWSCWAARAQEPVSELPKLTFKATQKGLLESTHHLDHRAAFSLPSFPLEPPLCTGNIFWSTLVGKQAVKGRGRNVGSRPVFRPVAASTHHPGTQPGHLSDEEGGQPLRAGATEVQGAWMAESFRL